MVAAFFAFVTLAGLSAVPSEAVSEPADATLSGAAIQLRPVSGPAGTLVGVRGTGFHTSSQDGCDITISFTDASGITTTLGVLPAAATFKTRVSIPDGAAVGPGAIVAFQWLAHDTLHFHCRLFVYGSTSASSTFTVTGRGRWLR
jgi:hypothetical protein